ncbi:tetratricopeptide repeat protein [Formosa haliotis]|uniref:tetratricopeptide repeat protein n=1 Tax=Formosa haliotis TaxID=1555194 RepID=UPI000824567D|nr:tetratricopeptide repeat protein [Formosa haliotis]
MKRIKLFIVLLLTTFQLIKAQSVIKRDSFYRKAEIIKYESPDSAAIYFQKSVDYQLQEQDTLAAINSLKELSFLYAHNVNYGKSYDGYWNALLLADKSNDSVSIASIYNQLGWLYSFYKRDNEALKYFNKAIAIDKKLKVDPIDYNTNLRSDYFSIAVFHRDNDQFELARKYLDSSNIYHLKITSQTPYFANSELGYILCKEGNYTEGLKLLKISESYFEESDPSYLTMIYYLLGEVYRDLNDFDLSELYLKKSLEFGEKYHTHSNYAPRNYQALSELYRANNKFKDAYKALLKANELNNNIFGGRSENNQHLLEIKDDFRVEKQKQDALLKEKRLAELEHEDKIWLLKTVLLIVVVLFISLFAALFVRNLRIKHKSEKLNLRKQQDIERKRQNDILELKNKQLAASALQLIEKDEFLETINSKLSKQDTQIDTNVIKRMVKSIQGNTASNWKEFEARFTNINQSFYANITEKFPKLSQTDQKLCALIKLNFSSKEMASILGISVESVHTSRYRLRKKLGLERNDNLTDFINEF